jgi:N-ethylmaleimide reductase
VEVHSANGYLLDQFIRDSTNKRTDQYGGSVANRIRLTLEVTAAVVGVWGADRVGIRLSPITPQVGDIPLDSDPMGTYGALVDGLRPMGQALRQRFGGLYMANNGFDRDMALKARRDDLADLVCFGRPFIGNPDLVERLREDAPLADAPKETWYGGGAHGYTDYPTLAQQKQAAA